jgi:hypothetical protein
LGRLDQAEGLITRNPNTTIVIDHLGLPQPFEPPVPAEPWADLPKVLELAAYDNVRSIESVLIGAVCSACRRSAARTVCTIEMPSAWATWGVGDGLPLR